MEILRCDANGLVALHKPAGVLSHPNRSGEERRSLLQAGYTLDGEYFQWRDTTAANAAPPLRVWLLNRLDSATSGVILLAATEALARHIRAQFRTQRIHKTYLALVFGRPAAEREVWRDRLSVEKKGGLIRTEGGGNIPAECAITVRGTGSGAVAPMALLVLQPRTGRSHQLRVQCAKRHLPIVGDATYGDFKLNRAFAKAGGTKRLFLHSLATQFDYEWAGRRHHFAAEAPPPPEFSDAMKG